MEYLAEKIRPLLACSDEVRIRYCNETVWVKTSIAKAVIQDIRDMANMTRAETVQCSALVGNSGMGKTTILTRVQAVLNKTHPDTVLYVDLAFFGVKMDIRVIFLSLLGLTISPTILDTVDGIKIVRAAIEERGVKVVIFDEAATILRSKKLGANALFLRALSNPALGLNVILAGPAEEIKILLNSADMRTRFGIWEIHDWGTTSLELSRFLKTFARYLPLKEESRLHDEEVQTVITNLAGTLTRNIVRVVRAAAVYAIRHKQERIDKDVLVMSHSSALSTHQVY